MLDDDMPGDSVILCNTVIASRIADRDCAAASQDPKQMLVGLKAATARLARSDGA
ncbi:MAG: hypothetical protein ACLQJR_30235 [Stellaceae bacterium]